MSKTERPSRRAALLGDRPGSYAIARHVRMSASKCRRVINLVRGMDAVDAVTMLKFQPQAAAEPIRKVIAPSLTSIWPRRSLPRTRRAHTTSLRPGRVAPWSPPT